MNGIKRGDIFYIARGGTCGNEQQADRPAVVVSNNKGNENSGVIEVVYLTTQPKTDLPTHAVIRSTGRVSTVLCEQVTTVSTDRIGGYIGQCTAPEIKNIDTALMISLELDGNTEIEKKYEEEYKRQQEEIESLKRYIEQLNKTNKELPEKSTDKLSELVEIPRTGLTVQTKRWSDRKYIVVLQTERDTYKTLYENIFERIVVAGGMKQNG